MFSRETRQLRDLILDEARDRGVALEVESLTIEQELPVLRLRVGDRVLRASRVRLPGTSGSPIYPCDVITVMGSAYRSSRMWPRRRDGTFRIEAVVDHLLALVGAELQHERPDPKIAVGVPARESGLHVLHAAAVMLGTIEPDVAPVALVEHLKDDKVRKRIETRLAGDGLNDGDLRALGEAVGMFIGRSLKADDPLTPINNEILTMMKFGLHRGDLVQHRHVLLLDRHANKVRIADPSGEGVVELTFKAVEEAMTLGATKGKAWVATASRWGRA